MACRLPPENPERRGAARGLDRFPLSPAASRAFADGGLEALRRDTGAFLAVELPEGEGAQPTLRAVGSEDDFERIEMQLARGFE